MMRQSLAGGRSPGMGRTRSAGAGAGAARAAPLPPRSRAPFAGAWAARCKVRSGRRACGALQGPWQERMDGGQQLRPRDWGFVRLHIHVCAAGLMPEQPNGPLPLCGWPATSRARAAAMFDTPEAAGAARPPPSRCPLRTVGREAMAHPRGRTLPAYARTFARLGRGPGSGGTQQHGAANGPPIARRRDAYASPPSE